MQIDFHHAVTYVLSRLAGFSETDADIISYSSQYVDDATIHGVVRFTNDAMYTRTSSANRILDLHNTNDIENNMVWVPFHFLPGNGGFKAGIEPKGGFINKLVCTPDSFVAQDMLATCIADRDKPYALHRLGVTIHVLADTFSHQGFAGIVHKINAVTELDYDGETKTHSFFKDFFDKIKSSFVDKVIPLGHCAAFACPDLPYLKWRYTNELNQNIVRNNPSIFNVAVKRIFESLIKYKNNDAESVINERISYKDFKQIKSNILSFTNENGSVRHQQWIDSIARGEFSFGQENISYIPKGEGSWKYLALNSESEKENGRYEYSPSFLSSNWKMFHDALQKHRFEVIHDILPKYGICVS